MHILWQRFAGSRVAMIRFRYQLVLLKGVSSLSIVHQILPRGEIGRSLLFGLAILAVVPGVATAEKAEKAREISWHDLMPVTGESGEIDYSAPWDAVRLELDKQDLRIPGYIVPLEFDDQQVVTKFLLVPYFGACIHEPPPPPNQTIYAEYESGIKLESIYDPFWIEGRMSTTTVVRNIATAAYSMNIDKVEPYEMR